MHVTAGMIATALNVYFFSDVLSVGTAN